MLILVVEINFCIGFLFVYVSGWLVSGDMGDGDGQSKELERSTSSRRSSVPSAANAATRMKFASVDALSELVWSPRNGLSLRCADFSFTGKAKLLSPNFFDIGQTNINMSLHSHSTSIEQQQEDVELRTQDQESNEMNRTLSGY